MINLIVKLRENNTVRKILFIGIVVFLFSYTLSIPAFSGRSKWFIISYFLMAVLASLTLIYIFLYKKFKFNKWLFVPLSFVLFAFFGTATYSHEFRSWLTLILMFFTLLVFYYAFTIIGNTRFILKIISFAFLGFAAYYFFVYRNEIIYIKISNARLGGYFDNVNTIGFYFAIAFTLNIYLGLFFEKTRELLYLLPALIFFVLGFFTGSRSFLVTVVVGSIFVMFFRMKNHKIAFLILLVVLVGFCFGLINIPKLSFLKIQFEKTIYTLFGIGNSEVDPSTTQRAVWPRYGFYLAGQNLLTGFGANGFSIYSGVGTYAHNNFAEIMCNFGIIGFILFQLSYLIPFVLSIKSTKKETYLVPIFVMVFLFRSLFGVIYYTKETYLVLALLFYLSKDYKLPQFKRDDKKV